TSIVDVGAERAITTMEVKNFSIVIPVYNNPLGMNLENVRDEIKSMQDSVENGWWSWMTTLRTIFEYMQSICSIFGSIYSLYGTYKEIKEYFAAARTASEAGGVVTEGATEGLQQAENVAGGEVVALDAVFSDGIIENLYGVICGLLVQCRVSQGGGVICPEGKSECTVDDVQCKEDTWCKVRKVWTQWNQLWIGWMDKIYLTDAGLRFTETPAGEGARVGYTQYDSGMFSMGGKGKTRGPGEEAPVSSVFNKDDFDPKKSIISSVFSACLPGIIGNIEKQRQILCQKLLCYKAEVAQGTPIYICDQTYWRATCIHWVGQIFMAIPIFQYLEGISQQLQDLVAHPEYILPGLALDVVMDYFCSTPKVTVGFCTAGHVLRWGSHAASAIMGVVHVAQSWKYNGIDVCEEAVKKNPDPSKIYP
ncbi:MAG: hypothetical protein KJ574_04005, partial [Nanoarchaeota archaeon]|nr:hypothetical protein [Nanoarchaeota archaeon]